MLWFCLLFFQPILHQHQQPQKRQPQVWFPRLNKYFPLSSARAHVSTHFCTEGRSYAGLDRRGLERSNKNSNVRKDALNFLELMEKPKGPRPPDKAFCVAGTGEVPCHAHVQDEGRVGG